MANNPTIQTGIKNRADTDLTKYALFIGGPNVTNEVLKSFDPQRTGWGRLFMVRKPAFVVDGIQEKMKYFKHILEYANTAVSGIGNYTLQSASMTGGYGGRTINVPTHTTDDMNSFSVQVYDFSGSPVREVLDYWINGISDKITTFSHYNGSSLDKTLANQSAEFIYVSTDNTGEEVEYACLLANAFPTEIDIDNYNYSAGQHELAQITINFNCTRYDSIQINRVAKHLLNKYKVLSNSLNFYSGYSVLRPGANSSGDGVEGIDTATGAAFGYDTTSGQLTTSAVGRNNNIPLNDPENPNSSVNKQG